MSNEEVLVALHSGGGDHASGLIAQPDVVLVPAPPAWFLDPERDVSAIVLPPGGEPAQELTPRRLAVLSVNGSAPLVAYLEVAETISEEPLRISGDAMAGLGDALEASRGDYWEALASIGAISAELAARRGNGVPPGVRGAGHRVASTRQTSYESYSDLAGPGCCLPPCGCHKRSLFAG